jgi:hypothetical protein
MWKAYDTFLQSEVSAVLAAKTGGSERYRYECADCGEEVRLAAVDSTKVDPYFKHLVGNNSIDCIEYLGRFGEISINANSRKSKNERAEFYFDNNTKLFYLGLRFSDDEIAVYEQQSAIFKLGTSVHGTFFNLQINSVNFQPDIVTMIPIDKFAFSYFLSNTFNRVKREYEFFKNNTPTFLKIQNIGDDDFKAKFVRSPLLYTNVQYFMVYSHQYPSVRDEPLPTEMEIKETFEFETMNIKFRGVILTIIAKTASIDSKLSSWGYQLEPSVKLTLLWPPAITVNEAALITTKYAYLYSTFELLAHGNINVFSTCIKKIASRLWRVSTSKKDEKIKILKKNAELTISNALRSSAKYNELHVAEKFEKTYSILDDNGYFLFNKRGVIPKSKGEYIWLTSDSEIRHYMSSYLVGRVLPVKPSKLSDKRLLIDILAHYKMMEVFLWDDFASLSLSSTACQYIESCEKSGLINATVKSFIKEGLL